MPLLDEDQSSPSARDQQRAYERLAQQYFSMPYSALMGRVGEDRAREVLDELSTTPHPLHGPTRSTGDILADLAKGSEDLAASLFAKADARARASEARARAEESRRLKAHLTREMRYGSFAVGFDVTKHINNVVKRNGNLDMLLNMVFADKRFKKAYPGILDRHGDIKMTVAEYNGRRDEARAEFAKAGLKLTDTQFGYLIGRNVSPNEAAARAQIAAFIKGNADLLVSVKQQVADINASLKSQGKPAVTGLNTMADIANFVTKNAPGELYSTYEGAVIATAAQRAGISVSAARARELGGAEAGIEDLKEAEEKFKQLADQVRVAGVELNVVGLTQADLETIQFGGKNRAALAAKAETALRARQATIENVEVRQSVREQGGRLVTGGTAPGA